MKRETNTWILLENEKMWDMNVSKTPMVVGKLGKKTGGTEDKRNRDHLDHNIFKLT